MLILNKRIQGCVKCGLCKLMPHERPVVGYGKPWAKFFIVSDFPRKEESLLEEPLAGLNHMFLKKCLQVVKIDIEDCYISNFLKCRPTKDGKNNRPPHKKEKNMCYTWLNEEIDEIKPKVILGLGKIAMQYLLNTKTNMDGNVGEIYRLDEAQLLCTYHPSYVLQQGRVIENEFIEHLKKAKALLDGV